MAANVHRALHVKLYAINPDFMRAFACEIAIHREGCSCHMIYNFGRLEGKYHIASPAGPYGQGSVLLIKKHKIET